MNFGQLKANLLAMIGRPPADVCYSLTTADINSRLRIREMEKTATLVAAAEIVLPADFLGVVGIYRDVADRTALQPTTVQGLNRSFNSSGTSAEYALVNGKMVLNPAPNGTENIEMRYFGALPELVMDTDENPVLTKHPAVYVYGALAHHAILVRDMDAAPVWKGSFDEAMRQARATDTSDRYSGAPLVPVVRVAP